MVLAERATHKNMVQMSAVGMHMRLTFLHAAQHGTGHVHHGDRDKLQGCRWVDDVATALRKTNHSNSNIAAQEHAPGVTHKDF